MFATTVPVTHAFLAAAKGENPLARNPAQSPASTSPVPAFARPLLGRSEAAREPDRIFVCGPFLTITFVLRSFLMELFFSNNFHSPSFGVNIAFETLLPRNIFRASASTTFGRGERISARMSAAVFVRVPAPLPSTRTSAACICFWIARSCARDRYAPGSFLVIRSGERSFKAQATFSGAITMTDSAPVRSAAIAARYTAPTNSSDPPTTSTRDRASSEEALRPIGRMCFVRDMLLRAVVPHRVHRPCVFDNEEGYPLPLIDGGKVYPAGDDRDGVDDEKGDVESLLVSRNRFVVGHVKKQAL